MLTERIVLLPVAVVVGFALLLWLWRWSNERQTEASRREYDDGFNEGYVSGWKDRHARVPLVDSRRKIYGREESEYLQRFSHASPADFQRHNADRLNAEMSADQTTSPG